MVMTLSLSLSFDWLFCGWGQSGSASERTTQSNFDIITSVSQTIVKASFCFFRMQTPDKQPDLELQLLMTESYYNQSSYYV